MGLKLFILYIVLFGIPYSHAASNLPFHLKLDTQQEKDREKIEQFFQEQFAKMPKKMRDALAGKVEIIFDHVGREKFATVCPTEEEKKKKIGSRPAAAISKKTGGKFQLTIHPNFIDAISAGENNPIPGCANYPTLFALGQASSLHELAHAYDFTNQESKEFTQLRQTCESQRSNPESPKSIDELECQLILRKETSLSTDPHYLAAMGWETKGFGYRFKNAGVEKKLKSGEVVTILPRRDTYQRTNPFEHFAVNMERFLLDPEYACRLPTEYNILQKHFGEHPHGEPKCNVNTKVPSSSSGAELIDIDPKRIYQIHYFLADKGENIESRWGHSMFRLIVCAPERTTVGPDCLKDTNHHQVLSYRMSVTDESSDFMGMVMGGKYPSRPYFLNYLETMYEYTRQEMRNVVSTPLNLSEEQKNNFINHALEQFWTYNGRYAFIDNNCATESRDFLKAILPANHAFQNKFSNTPRGLYEDLIQTGLAPDIYKLDKKAVVDSTLLSESYKDRLDKAWQRLVDRKAIPAEMTKEQYLAKKPEERRAIFEKIINERPQEQKAIAGGYFLLELHARNFKSTDNAMKKMQQILDEIKKGKSNNPAMAELEKILKDSIESNDPWNLVTKGYGIPSADELLKGLEVFAQKSQKQKLELEKIRHLLEEMLKSKFQVETFTAENVDCVRDIMYGNISQ